MARRIAAAAIYSLLVVAFVWTWPKWTSPPQVDSATVITSTPARWWVICIPFIWGWAVISFEGKWPRRVGLAGSALLLVACLLFIWYHDSVLGYMPCLWDGPGCGNGWFN